MSRHTLLIRGCGILTMNPAGEQIPRGDIYIENDRLRHVGAPFHEAPEGTDIIDGAGKVALPGFISGHHHLFQALLKGASPNANLRQWLSSCILPTSPHFQPEDLQAGVRLSLAECLESGVTSVVDWSFNLHTVEHAAAVLEGIRDSGARVHFAYGPSMRGGWGDFDLHLEDFEEVRSRYFGAEPISDRISLWAGLAGPELQDEARFRDEVAIARRHGCRIHIHLREAADFEPVDAVERLDRWGILGPHLLLAHAVHLRDVDLDLVARSGTKISYNALANMRVADGVCRVVELRERGADIALGLDGSGSNDNNDYFALMRVALGLQRARWLRGDCLTVEDALDMATRGGAKCVGMENEIGSLEPGKKADVILIDPRTLNFTPLNDFVAQLVFCAQPRNVDTVIVDGQVLKRHGELVGTDVEAVSAQAQEAATRIAQKAGFPPRFVPG